MTSLHHEQRLEAVHAIVRARGASRVVDLGCGDGDLFVRLAMQNGMTDLVGVDICRASLDRLRDRLVASGPVRASIDLRRASMTEPAPDLAGFDCALLVETIEHLGPDRLSQLARAIFHRMVPKTVVITTPNAEFNALLGVPRHRMRHPGHLFEWDRARFRRWCARAIEGAGYEVRLHDIAGYHPDLGGVSQMAVFDRDKATTATRVA